MLGAFEDSPFSTKKIDSFIKNFGIDMSEYESSTYRSFNEFFIRKFHFGLRPFAIGERLFCAGAEARYLAFENISSTTKVRVKGIEIDLPQLFGNGLGQDSSLDFEGSTLIIARLCPVDYHRFHFPIDCTITSSYTVHGELHSVNPTALEKRPEIFLINERQIAILENALFGKVAMIEVGALGVGKIIQTVNPGTPVKFEKGQEKGYFLFGGSTVLWLVQKGKIVLSRDLLENSLQGVETWIPLGDVLGEFPHRDH